MEYTDYFSCLQKHSPKLAEDLAKVRTLEHVLAWMEQRELSLATIDIVTQDEYSLDFIIPLGRSQQVLVFGIT